MLGSTMTQMYQVGSGGTIPATTDSTQAFATVVFDWKVTHQDVVNNQSTIEWSLKVTMTSNTAALRYTANQIYNRMYSSSWQNTSVASIDFGQKNSSSAYAYWVELYLNGSYDSQLAMKKGYVSTLKPGETTTLAAGTKTVKHNNDGTLNVAFKYMAGPGGFTAANGSYISTGTDGLNANSPSAMRQEATYAIDTIARRAIIYTDEAREVKDFNDEQTVAINYAVPSGVTGYIYFSLDGDKNTETTSPALNPVTGSGTYTFKFSAADQKKLWTIQPLLTKRVRFFIKSVSPADGKEYREPSNYVNLEIINFMPTLDTDVWEDENNDCVKYLTGNNRKMVRHVSVPKFKTGGQAHKDATIDIQYCTHGGVTEYGATGDFVTVSGTETEAHFDFAITDNYGRTTPATTQFSTAVGNYVPYVKLTCAAVATPMTGDGDVTVTITGKFFSGDFGLKTNKMRINFDIAENNGEWVHYDVGYATSAAAYGNSFVINGTDYTYTLNLNTAKHGLKYLNVYDLRIRVSDEVVINPIEVDTILAAVPIFDWSRTDFAFYVPVTIQEATVPSIVAQTLSDSGWSYRKWSDGTAECWRTLTINSSISTATTTGNWFSSGEKSATNLSYPFTFAARPTVTVSAMPTGSSYCVLFPSNTAGSTTKTGSYQLMSTTSQTARDHLISYQVKGRWK